MNSAVNEWAFGLIEIFDVFIDLWVSLLQVLIGGCPVNVAFSLEHDGGCSVTLESSNTVAITKDMIELAKCDEVFGKGYPFAQGMGKSDG